MKIELNRRTPIPKTGHYWAWEDVNPDYYVIHVGRNSKWPGGGWVASARFRQTWSWDIYANKIGKFMDPRRIQPPRDEEDVDQH